MNASLDINELGQTSETAANYTKNVTIATPSGATITKIESQDVVRMSDDWSDIFESTLDVGKGSMVVCYNHDLFLNHKARKEIETILNGERD